MDDKLTAYIDSWKDILADPAANGQDRLRRYLCSMKTSAIAGRNGGLTERQKLIYDLLAPMLESSGPEQTGFADFDSYR